MKEDKMYIALVIQDLYRLGAQYVTSLVAKGLAQRGYQVDVIVSEVHAKLGRERPDLVPFTIPDTVRLIQLPHLKASRNIVALARYLWREQPDVVIPMSSNYESACALACCILPNKIRPYLIPVEHSGGIGMTSAQTKIFFREGFARRWVTRLADTRADHVVAVSQGVAQALVQIGKFPRERITAIYNPVVDNTFLEKRAASAAHPWLAKKSGPVIVAAGAHVPLKGYDVLLQAFANVARLMDCRLILFGEGVERENLKRLAQTLGVSEFVSFPGHTENLPAELMRADLFVVSSHCESFSVVLVEALACGVPVVATNCPSGPPEILQNGKFGILVDPGNPEALAGGIMQALSGKGIKPPEESWSPYTLDRVIDQYERVLKMAGK